MKTEKAKKKPPKATARETEKRKMVEELVKPATLEEQSNISVASNPIPNLRIGEEDEEELEEGEIVGGEEDSKGSSTTTAVTHPLEHSWTFWFDNPSAKSKQAAWGSSMRPIYTYSSVEEFWRFFASLSGFYVSFSLCFFGCSENEKVSIFLLIA